MIKKISVVIIASLFVITALIFADKISNKKLSDSISLLYMYFTSPREVFFEKMLIQYPYNYIMNMDQESLILQQYPQKEIIIIFRKSDLLNFEEFFDNYSYRLEKLKYNSINKKSKEIHDKPIQALVAKSKADHAEYKAYVYIPFNKVVIEYIGSENGSTEFWNTLETIRFNSNIKLDGN